MKPTNKKASPTEAAAEAYKSQKAEQKARYKLKALEWKEANTASKKVAPHLFNTNKYRCWLTG